MKKAKPAKQIRTAWEAHQAVMNKKPVGKKTVGSNITVETPRILGKGKGSPGVPKPHTIILGTYSRHYFVRALADKGCTAKEALHVLKALGDNPKRCTVAATVHMQTAPGSKMRIEGVKLQQEHLNKVNTLIAVTKTTLKAAKAKRVQERTEKQLARDKSRGFA